MERTTRTTTKTTALIVVQTVERSRAEVGAERTVAAVQSTKSIAVTRRAAAMVTITAEDIRIQRRSLMASAAVRLKARAKSHLDRRPHHRLQGVERSLVSVTRRRPSRKSHLAERDRPSNSRQRMAEQCSLLHPTTRYTISVYFKLRLILCFPRTFTQRRSNRTNTHGGVFVNIHFKLINAILAI